MTGVEVERLTAVIQEIDGWGRLSPEAYAAALYEKGVWVLDKGEKTGPRYPKGFVDQEPPTKHPERHIRVFTDPMTDEPRICVFTMNNPKDVYRGVSLSIQHAEQMAGLLLELVQKAKKEATHD